MNELGQGLDKLMKELPKIMDSMPQMVKDLQRFISMMENYVWISGICLVALVIFSVVLFMKLNKVNQKLTEMDEKFNNLSRDIHKALSINPTNSTDVSGSVSTDSNDKS